MDNKKCSHRGCIFDADYECKFHSPEIYLCSLHVIDHVQLNETHTVDTVCTEPFPGTKEALLEFLEKVASKHTKMKNKILESFGKRIFDTKNDIRDLLNKFNSDSDELRNCLSIISQAKKISTSDQNSILGLLSLKPEEAIKKVEMITPSNPEWYNNTKEFCGFSEKIEKMIEAFIKDKFENYLDKRLMKIESTLEERNKPISPTNQELEYVKDTISCLINENNKSWTELENWKSSLKEKTENDISLLNFQMASLMQDIGGKLKRPEKTAAPKVIEKVTLQNLREMQTEICKKPNDPKLEEKFRKICLLCEKSPSMHDSKYINAYQDCITTYHQRTSVYSLIIKDFRSNLVIYDTERERKEVKILNTHELLNNDTCIAQLPNGKLFCYGNSDHSGVTLTIDGNGSVQDLPSGIPCSNSSAIYFNQNVYCFGGWRDDNLDLSSKFDLDANQWIALRSMPSDDCFCNSIIFNRNILISGFYNRNILRYSIDNNSFTTISHEFEEKKTKILINAARLYLIECCGSIYECEIGSDSNWRFIEESAINNNFSQIYCAYNNGAIYIACNRSDKMAHYKFNLGQGKLIALS